MRYILTQNYTDELTELFNLTSPINKAYAENNGFEYITSNKKRCSNRLLYWEKIAWLNEFLPTIEDNSLIVYEDCDSLNLSGDFKTGLHPNFEMGMVHIRRGLGGKQLMNWFNSGVIFIINTPDVRDFFQRVWNRNDNNDELSINKEYQSLNNSIGKSKSICSLNVEWNNWKNNEHLANTAYIKSFHGLKYEDKLQQIKDFLNNTKA